MSLFRDSLRPPAIFSDEAVERYLAAIRAELGPDPHFRGRLRGQVLNRYVAAREGIGDAPTAARTMGRLGRAVLYASFTLAFSVTGVMAASQEALPGELLYPLKRQVEELRFQVLPAHLHDDLATYALGERIHELDELAERGDWDRVIALAGTIEQDYLALADALESDSGQLDRHIVVLNGLLETLPATARTAVEDVLDGMPGIGQPPDGHPVNGAAGGPGGPGIGSGNANADPTPKPTKEPKPTKSAAPAPTLAPTAKPQPTPMPQPTLEPVAPTPDPEATPRPTPGPRAPSGAQPPESVSAP
jgi:hypothetical protein